ncbi:MAG: glycosyltransferase family 2 protein [Acidimicrobiales bacterium]
MTARQRVDVGVVTWNTADLTVEALRHLVDSDQGVDIRILVHDNASSDATADAVARAIPQADVVRHPHNVGFAGAVNMLLDRSDAPWFLALNSDAWPEPGAIGAMVQRAESEPRAAAVAPLLRRPDGEVEHSCHPFPSFAVAAVDALGARRCVPRGWADTHLLEGAWRHDRARSVDWAVGAALLLRRDALDEVGGLDERFFMYVEDLEWCWRVHRAGWEVWFEPGAVVRHVGNASGERRFGQRRAALEAMHLRWFTDDTMGPTRARRYRALLALGQARQYAVSKLSGNRVLAAQSRLALRSTLGFVPPPVVRDADTSAGDAGPATPELAVVIPTHDRAARLARLVDALAAQTLDPARFEVVIVDDASSDETPDVLEKSKTRVPFALTVLRTARCGGPAAARNLGWKSTDAPVIAFTDDDCVPDPQWLEKGLAAMAGAPRVVVGRTAPPPDQIELAGRPFARVMEVDSARFFETCNVFYRRRDLDVVGGFDPRFRRPSGEDTHLGLRVAELGVDAVFSPDALVHHDVRPGGLRDVLAESVRWADLPLVLKDRPYARHDRVHRIFFWKATHQWVILAAVGMLLGLRWRTALLLVAPWVGYRLARNPVAHRMIDRVWTLPGAFALDVTEVATMARGSVRHRTILL